MPKMTKRARRRRSGSANALTMTSAPIPAGSPMVMAMVGRMSVIACPSRTDHLRSDSDELVASLIQGGVQQILFVARQIPLGLLVQRAQHVHRVAGGIHVHGHSLPGARAGIDEGLGAE